LAKLTQLRHPTRYLSGLIATILLVYNGDKVSTDAPAATIFNS
jgi:hypothetical protein